MMMENDARGLEEGPREESQPKSKTQSGVPSMVAKSSTLSLLVPTTKTTWKQWLLASLVAVSIGWVMLWTTLATHTGVTRETIYPALESKYFNQYSGARMFTYLGIFYLFLGTVSYAALMAGIRMPKPSPSLVQVFHAPIPFTHWDLTLLEAGAFMLFCALLVATFLARVFNRFEFGYWPSERYVYEVAKTFGKTIALILMVLLFPVSKSCFWWDLFNFQFERVLKFHRWLAWLMVWVVIIHASTAIASLIMVNQFKACMWPNDDCEKPGGWDNWDGLEASRTFTYGWVTLLLGAPIVITSIAWVRRHHFELFYYTHFLFIPFFIMLHLHYDSMIYYMAPGVAAYTLDKVVWFYVTRRPTRIANLSSPAPGFVRIAIALEQGHKYEPGAWVQIKIPAISTLEWHPMSVASAPGHTTITIDVKVLGDWTENLAKLAARFDESRPSHTCIFVDKFHGSSHTEMQGYLSHPAVLMFAGGIGITPMMSAIRHIVEESAQYPQI
jgi:predicted ferric reductase